MKLIAFWSEGQDTYYDAPAMIRWGDGSTATSETYREHMYDSHFWVEKGHFGHEKHMFPDVVAHVTFDLFGGVWAAKGHGVELMGLNLTDPDASDDQIYSALNTGHMTYRMVVHRQ